MEEPPQHRNTTNSSLNSDLERSLSKEPYRFFNVFKDTAFGTNAFAFCLQVHPAGGNAQTPSPAYHTPRIPFYKQRFYLPASFDLYLGGSVVRRRDDATAVFSEKDHIASIRYKGIEGMFSLRVKAEIYQKQAATSQHVISSDNTDNAPAEKSKRFISITREGIGRKYRVELRNPSRTNEEESSSRPKIFYWKGSKAALSMLENQEHCGNGNLKLVAAGDPGEVLAVWQNRTDKEILGCLSVFARFEEGENGLLEDVIVSCLAVVLAERTSGRGWVGGLFK